MKNPFDNTRPVKPESAPEAAASEPTPKAEPVMPAEAPKPAAPKMPLDCPDAACSKAINHAGPHVG